MPGGEPRRASRWQAGTRACRHRSFRRSFRVAAVLVVALLFLDAAGSWRPANARPAECTRFGEHAVCGAIRDKYQAVGGPEGFLGLPTGGEFSAGAGRGRGSRFEHGEIYWSPATGAHEVHGAIRDKWVSSGRENSALGFPASDETTVSGRRQNTFENGVIIYAPDGPAREVRGAVYKAWAGNGGLDGRLGYPLADEQDAFGEGRVSFFHRGSVYWRGGAVVDVYASPDKPPALDEADTVYALPLDDFIAVHADRAANPNGSSQLNWTTDLCSGGITTPRVVDDFFRDACVRHDFGYRNFVYGLRLDSTDERRRTIDRQFLTDALVICERAGNPRIDWYHDVAVVRKVRFSMNCGDAAKRMWFFVRLFG